MIRRITLGLVRRYPAACREWIARGVASPLDDALAQVGYWTLERDAARARLQALGYRARFRWPPTSR